MISNLTIPCYNLDMTDCDHGWIEELYKKLNG